MNIQDLSDDFLRKQILFALYDSKGSDGGIDFKSIAKRVYKAYAFKDMSKKQRSKVSAKIRKNLINLFVEGVITYNFIKVKNDFVAMYKLSPQMVDQVRLDYQLEIFNALESLTKEQRIIFIKYFSKNNFNKLDLDAMEKYADVFEVLYKANLIYPKKVGVPNGEAEQFKWKITGLGWYALNYLFKNTNDVFEARMGNLNDTYFERGVLFCLYECFTHDKQCDSRFLHDVLSNKYLFYCCKLDLLTDYVNKTLKTLIAKKQVEYDIVEDKKNNCMKVVYRLTPQGIKDVAPVYSETIKNKAERLSDRQQKLMLKIQEKQQNRSSVLNKSEVSAQDLIEINSLLKAGLIKQYRSFFNKENSQYEISKNWRTSFEGDDVLKYLAERSNNLSQQQMQ